MPYAPPYLSSEPFDPAHPDALAVYCSDGRFTNAVEDLLRGLGHARLDTLTMPGGPALFNAWLAGMSQSVAVGAGARFLIESHGTRRVILVAHEGCGFYKKHYATASPDQVRTHQEDDLRRAAQILKDAHPRLEVLLYRATIAGQRVSFVPVDAV